MLINENLPLNFVEQFTTDHRTCKLCGSILQSINHITFIDFESNILRLRIPIDSLYSVYTNTQEPNTVLIFVDIKTQKIKRCVLDKSFAEFEYYQSPINIWNQHIYKIMLEEYIMTLMCPNYHYTINAKFKIDLNGGYLFGGYISDESVKFIGKQQTSSITNDYMSKKTIYNVSGGSKFHNIVYDLLAPTLEDPDKVLKRCQILDTFS